MYDPIKWKNGYCDIVIVFFVFSLSPLPIALLLTIHNEFKASSISSPLLLNLIKNQNIFPLFNYTLILIYLNPLYLTTFV